MKSKDKGAAKDDAAKPEIDPAVVASHKKLIEAYEHALEDQEAWDTFLSSASGKRFIAALKEERNLSAEGWENIAPKDLIETQQGFKARRGLITRMQTKDNAPERVVESRRKLRAFEDEHAMWGIVPYVVQNDRRDREKAEEAGGNVVEATGTN